jgi:hypothetical protein
MTEFLTILVLFLPEAPPEPVAVLHSHSECVSLLDDAMAILGVIGAGCWETRVISSSPKPREKPND